MAGHVVPSGPAAKVDPLGKAQLLGELSQRRRFRAVAYDNQINVYLSVPDKLLHGSDQVIRPFLPHQPSGEKHP